MDTSDLLFGCSCRSQVDAEGKFLFGRYHSAVAGPANHAPQIVEHVGFAMDRDPSVPASWVVCSVTQTNYGPVVVFLEFRIGIRRLSTSALRCSWDAVSRRPLILVRTFCHIARNHRYQSTYWSPAALGSSGQPSVSSKSESP